MLYRGFAVGLLCVYCGFAVGSLWVRCRFAVGSLWVRCGFAVGSLWVRIHGPKHMWIDNAMFFYVFQFAPEKGPAPGAEAFSGAESKVSCSTVRP